MFTIAKWRKGFIKYIVILFCVTVVLMYISLYESAILCHGLRTNVTEKESQSSDVVKKQEIERFFVDKYAILESSIVIKGNYVNKEQTSSSFLKIVGMPYFVQSALPTLLHDEKLKGIVRRKDRYFRDKRMVTSVDCRELVHGGNVVPYTKKSREPDWFETKLPLGPLWYKNRTKNCKEFINERGYIMDYLTEIEKNFSIAYSILIYRDVEQAERLIRAIYRPQNIYCLHIDAKSSEYFFEAIASIATCFDNIFLSSKRLDIKWGRMSVLTAELLCMRELWERSKTWKYFINLTGQEFPLRTNYELVKILQAYNGANDVESTVERANKYRWRWAGSLPYNVTRVKGSVHIVVQRGFVNYVLHDTRAKDILNWSQKTFVPDETFFAILNHNPSLHVPGSYSGLPETTSYNDPEKPFMARFKNWGDGLTDLPCHGERVHGLCIFGVGDLPLLVSRRELFANKFHLDYQPRAFDCLEEWHYNKTRDQYRGSRDFDARWYSQLGFVKNRND